MLSKCQICLKDSNPSVVTSCGHIYCRECLDGWMASNHSIRSCPIFKCQLKKEEFQELTSGVYSICQNTAKFPVLTTSGSLSCKTQCDQGLETSQVIPIYRTEDESEGEADQAVPPRPVLQPDDNSGSSTHVIQIDEDGSSSAISSESNRFFGTIKLIFQVIGFIISFVGISILVIIMTFPLIGVFFLLGKYLFL